MIQQWTEMGITGAELIKVGGAAFAAVVAAFFIGWQIGIAISLIRKL